MTRLRPSFIFAVAVVLASASSAFAAEPTDWAAWALPRVEKALLEPLVKRENARSGFSRSARPPSERRVRIPNGELLRDAKGRAFVHYVLEARRGDNKWSDERWGCIYQKTGALFVAIGDDYRSIDYLFGKKAEPVPGVCEEAPPHESS